MIDWNIIEEVVRRVRREFDAFHIRHFYELVWRSTLYNNPASTPGIVSDMVARYLRDYLGDDHDLHGESTVDVPSWGLSLKAGNSVAINRRWHANHLLWVQFTKITSPIWTLRLYRDLTQADFGEWSEKRFRSLELKRPKTRSQESLVLNFHTEYPQDHAET